MKKKFLFYLLILFCTSQYLLGQSTNIKSGYVSLHGGIYTVSLPNYKKYYDSKFGTIFGASLGVPLSTKIHLFGKISYFENNAIPISDITGLREGTSVLKQVIINGGMQFKIIGIDIIKVYLQSGLTIAIIDEERKNKRGAFTYEIEGNGNFGIFVGSILEIYLSNNVFSITGEFNYIYSWNPLLEYDKTYKAINIIGGVRYYLLH